MTLLLDEPLHFRVSEAVAALHEDYPELVSWIDVLWGRSAEGTDPGEIPMVAGEVVLGMLEDQRTGMRLNLSGYPGPAQMDFTSAVALSRGFKDAAEAARQHSCQFTLTVRTDTTDIGSRFLAAQAVTCLAAVFARMPVCLGVYVSTSQQILSPEACVAAADKAARLEWPFLEWMSIAADLARHGGRPLGHRANTIGLSCFLGCEAAFTPAPVALPIAATWCVLAMHLLLAGGHVFQDGSTSGDRESDEGFVRIRFLAEDRKVPVDRWMLVHHTSPVDDEKLFGRRRKGRHKVKIEDDPHFLAREVQRAIEAARLRRKGS